MSCPDREQLRAFLREGSPDLNDHIESCPRCQEALQGLNATEEAAVQGAAAMPPVPSTTGEPVRRLGVYELLRQLGAGGMGEVWLARHTLLKVLLAVKTLRPDRSGREALERFYREIQVYAQLEHPNIVAIRHADEIDGQPILVMRYVDGVSLHQLVRRHGPLAVADACELIRQAAVGLQFAHEKGIVHRDIKPGNLMLDRTLTVKVLDFGLARGGVTAEGPPMTTEGAILGTPPYMAPEQARGASKADIRADLYALGCTLYFLLTGKPPFAAEEEGGPFVVLYAHCNTPVPPIRERRPDVPVSLATLLETKLLAKDPKDRFRTPAELVKALHPFVRGNNLAQLMGVPVPAGGAGAEANRAFDPQAPLDAALDLVFWDPVEKRRLTLDAPGVLPVKEGDEFRIEVRLNQPAFVYLLWIDSQGNAIPVYPWEPGSDWRLGTGEEALAQLTLPAGDEGQVWPIRGPAGVETLVLLAREDESLSPGEHARFTGLLPKRFPRLPALPNPAQPRWLVCRQEECEAAGAGERGFDPTPRAPSDPQFQFDTLLRERLGPRFRLLQAVSFMNAGPKGVQS